MGRSSVLLHCSGSRTQGAARWAGSAGRCAAYTQSPFPPTRRRPSSSGSREALTETQAITRPGAGPRRHQLLQRPPAAARQQRPQRRAAPGQAQLLAQRREVPEQAGGCPEQRCRPLARCPAQPGADREDGRAAGGGGGGPQRRGARAEAGLLGPAPGAGRGGRAGRGGAQRGQAWSVLLLVVLVVWGGAGGGGGRCRPLLPPQAGPASSTTATCIVRLPPGTARRPSHCHWPTRC